MKQDTEGNKVRKTMVVHSFYITTWQEGVHLFSRTWTGIDPNPALLSGLLVSFEILAKDMTSQFVNHVNLEDFRFIFRVDEENKLLFVFITDNTVSVERYSQYLEILNTRFIDMFKNVLPTLSESRRDEYRFSTFEQVIDKYVSNWETAEQTLESARIIDTLELFTLFLDTILKKFFDNTTRLDNWDKIGGIFKTQIGPGSPLTGLAIHPDGNVFFDKIKVENIDYADMLRVLGRILRDMFSFTQRVLSEQAYQNLFFKHIIPLINSERERILTWQLTDHLVMRIL